MEIIAIIEFVLLCVMTYLWFKAGVHNGKLLNELQKECRHNEQLKKEVLRWQGKLLDDWTLYNEVHTDLLSHWTVRLTAWLR
jgi:hypothetical protein